MKKYSVSLKIAKLPEKEQKAWIDQQKKKPYLKDVDIEAAVKSSKK